MATRTMTSHRAVATILLLLVTTAVSTAQAQAAASEPGAGTGAADNGHCHGHGHVVTKTATRSARVPPAAVTVRCTEKHVVKAGETCASVARDFGLTVAQFMVLNQEHHYTCGAAPLPHGRWVCVRGYAIG